MAPDPVSHPFPSPHSMVGGLTPWVVFSRLPRFLTCAEAPPLGTADRCQRGRRKEHRVLFPLALILPAQRLKFPCVFIHTRHPLIPWAQSSLGSSYLGSSSPLPDVLRCWTLMTSPPFFVPCVEWLPAAGSLWVPSLSRFSAFPSRM